MTFIFQYRMVNVNCIGKIIVSDIPEFSYNLIDLLFVQSGKCCVVINTINKHASSLVIAKGTYMLSQSICF